MIAPPGCRGYPNLPCRGELRRRLRGERIGGPGHLPGEIERTHGWRRRTGRSSRFRLFPGSYADHFAESSGVSMVDVPREDAMVSGLDCSLVAVVLVLVYLDAVRHCMECPSPPGVCMWSGRPAHDIESNFYERSHYRRELLTRAVFSLVDFRCLSNHEPTELGDAPWGFSNACKTSSLPT